MTTTLTSMLLSEKALATDWDRPQKDEAWASLQQDGEIIIKDELAN